MRGLAEPRWHVRFKSRVPWAMLEPCRSELNAFLQEERRLVEARQRLQPSGTTPSEKWLWERVIEMRTMRAGGVIRCETGNPSTLLLGTLGSWQIYKTKS